LWDIGEKRSIETGRKSERSNKDKAGEKDVASLKKEKVVNAYVEMGSGSGGAHKEGQFLT